MKDNKNKKKKKYSTFKNTLKRMFMGSNFEDINVLEEDKMEGPVTTIFKNFFSNKIATVGLVALILMMLMSFILPIFIPTDLFANDTSQQNQPPGFKYLDVPKALNGNVEVITVGNSYSVGLSKDGEIFQWGVIDNRIAKVPNFSSKVVNVVSGEDHVLAMDENGKIYTWGNSRFGLGQIPVEVQGLNNIVDMEAGVQVSFVVDAEGNAYFWGNDLLINMNLTPHQGNIAKIETNNYTVMGISKEGKVISLSSSPTALDNMPEINEKVVDIAMTNDSILALTESGKVYAWGENTAIASTLPEELASGGVKQIVSGKDYFSVLKEDGTIVSWGDNAHGQLNAKKAGYTELFAGTFQNYAVRENGKIDAWGLSGYLMGTDQHGRDVFSRLIAGGRTTMTVGGVSVIISLIIGVIVGGLAGYYGGKVDFICMRLAEIVGSLPFLPFAIILSVFIGSSVPETFRIIIIMVVLGILSWPAIARLVRSQILAEREKEFVTAAKAVGIKEGGIIFRHIMPNVIAIIIVNATLAFASSMLTESSLSYLGFGVIEPNATWGNMLTGSQNSKVLIDYWWRWLFPAIALSLTTISINLIGDGLNEAIDPKSQER